MCVYQYIYTQTPGIPTQGSPQKKLPSHSLVMYAGFLGHGDGEKLTVPSSPLLPHVLFLEYKEQLYQ